MTTTLSVRALDADVAAACASLTYPAYRHMLALEPTQRHLGAPSQPLVQPLGAVAFDEGKLVGLALAERPLEGSAEAELLSVFVPVEFRKRGVATALVGGIEDALAAAGVRRVQAVYMTGKPEIEALSRIFDKRAWDAPVVRTVTVRFTPAEAATTGWYGKMQLGPEFEIFSWTELRPEERTQLQESQARERWIKTGLEPWKHDSYPFDPVSSVGLRYRGEVVGWVINHPIDKTTLRFTCSFMRADLSRRGRILPLYSASIERAKAAGTARCTFVTPVEYHEMIAFVKRHCERWVSFVGETRGVTKSFA
jgi:GNAT superfamily N-acetyltransferase